MMTVRAFVEEHFQHFNAGALRQTARSLTAFLGSLTTSFDFLLSSGAI